MKTELSDIKLVAFDVDGVFTDGRFYLSDDGVETKSFHTQDGYGVRRLIELGLQVAVISGRSSGAVRHRMGELGVQHVVLACKDKVAALDEIVESLGITAKQSAYVGDDVPDLPLLHHVGFAVAVANAVAEVREAADYTTEAHGGFGAVREVCELIGSAQGQTSV